MLKKLIYNIIVLKDNFLFSRKIRKIWKSVKKRQPLPVDKNILAEHRRKWKALGRSIDTRWIRTYTAVSGISSPDYIPENIYYTIVERVLNDQSFSGAYADKNFYDRYYDPAILPETLLRAIDGKLFNKQYEPVDIDNGLSSCLSGYEKLILKPSTDSGGGFRVRLIDARKEESSGYENLKKILTGSRNLVVQDYIEQHDFFRQFNDTSLNTVRIFTYHSVAGRPVIPLHCLLRIGRPGSIVDNQASGGISCGIRETGALNPFAVDKNGVRYESFNGVVFSGKKVPFFDTMLNMAGEIALKNIHARLLGLDFCVDTGNRVRLIEVNNKNHEINFYQMNNGPLFGEYTDEVIQWCKTNPRSVCLDFQVT
jgi:hypothetical protein